MNLFQKIFAPKTQNSKINALLGFMHNETLTDLAQGAKEKLARLQDLVTGQISQEDAKRVKADLLLQQAIDRHAAKIAATAAAKAEAQAKLTNLDALIKVADGILDQEIE